MSARKELDDLGSSVKTRFLAEKRVLSFEEYLDEFLSHPARYARDAATYVRDCFDHFGTEDVQRPWGPVRRFRLFDQAFLDGGDGHARYQLVGHEGLQQAFYRALGNFVREGRANRLLLLHGPNGSAKSTFAACVMRALEHYARTSEGAVYRFSWVFPAGHDDKSIGFGARSKRPGSHESYAHLEAERVASRLASHLPEHPLLLLPLAERRQFVKRALEGARVEEAPSALLWNGELAQENAEIRDALLKAYGGDLARVLAHVQVERLEISRRYRRGAVTIGPQMTVDAGERQITADRTLAQLPAALSSLALFEPHGELVDGSCGLIEYSDLLKRPLDAWKYLLMAIETGEVALNHSILPVNAVLLGSTNETHLEAFRQHPEYDSFRARLTLLRVGYLLHYREEQRIYDSQIIPQLRVPVAPHATFVAALWAVLTRLLRSDPAHYEDPQLGKLVADLTPMEKAHLFADGAIPRRLSSDDGKLLRANLAEVVEEFDHITPYQGLFGASPREIRTLLLDAAHWNDEGCLSPLSVMDQIEALCEGGDYDFLKLDPDGGYHDPIVFLGQVRKAWLSIFDNEVRSATGLVDESQYDELFARYVTQVSLWVKGERFRDPLTGDERDPDETLFERIEEILEVEDADAFRRNLISGVAAHAIDHPGDRMDYAAVFPDHLERVREAYFVEHRSRIGAIVRDVLLLIDDATDQLDQARQQRAQEVWQRLQDDHGYCGDCARAALGVLIKEYYAE
ncbi:MAG: serine protein kinase PrkA [Myxococcales bacterium]|nr:serine protein kinase PrkA [Myxococcales bacterium]